MKNSVKTINIDISEEGGLSRMLQEITPWLKEDSLDSD